MLGGRLASFAARTMSDAHGSDSSVVFAQSCLEVVEAADDEVVSEGSW